LDYYGPERGLVLFRKHVVRYISGAPGVGEARLPLLTCTTAGEFIDLFSAWEERNAQRAPRQHVTSQPPDEEIEEFESCALEAAM
jgi:hypothetical protein